MATNGNQSTYLSEVTFPEFTNLVEKEWISYNQLPVRNAAQLFIKSPVGPGEGDIKQYDEVDYDTFADYKPRGARHKKAKVGVGFQKQVQPRAFSKEIDIEYELRKDNKYDEVSSRIVSLAGFAENRLELDLTHRFTFSNTVSYVDMNGQTVDLTTADGLAVISSVHELAFSPKTYSNVVTGNPVFSSGAFQIARKQATTQILNNFGVKRVINFNTIVSGEDPETVDAITQVRLSTADIGAPNAGVVNVDQGKFRHVVLSWLDSTATGAYNSAKRRWWFYVSAGLGQQGWQAYLRMWDETMFLSPSSGNNGEDMHTMTWTYATYIRYGIVIVSPRGCIAAQPTS